VATKKRHANRQNNTAKNGIRASGRITINRAPVILLLESGVLVAVLGSFPSNFSEESEPEVVNGKSVSCTPYY
jgi:hypothetical protein